MMNNDDQKIIDLYLKTRQQQPSAQLDNKVILAAKNHLANNKNKPKKLIWALSSVAVIVLSVNVALKLLIEPSAISTPYAPKFSQEELLTEADDMLERESIQSGVEAANNNNIARRQLAKKEVVQQKKAIQEYKATESKKKMAQEKQRLSYSRPLPSASIEMEALPLSDSMADLNPLPLFSFDNEKLSHLYPLLIIKKTQENTIQIFKDASLILNLKKLNNGLIKVTAYPQGNELKLNVDWSSKPSCNLNQTNKQCLINQKQTGHYENNRLISVTWMQ